jgi:hypothetical protein
MPGATLRISKQTRETLRRLAYDAGEPMQAILDRAVEEYRRRLMVDQVNAGYAALRQDPAAWAALEEERRAWDQTLADGLAPRVEWSES